MTPRRCAANILPVCLNQSLPKEPTKEQMQKLLDFQKQISDVKKSQSELMQNWNNWLAAHAAHLGAIQKDLKKEQLNFQTIALMKPRTGSGRL